MKSNLVAIIKRLEAMKESGEEDVQTRRFESDGELKAEVTFQGGTDQLFVLNETKTGYTSTFDDVDILAMEIYDLLF